MKLEKTNLDELPDVLRPEEAARVLRVGRNTMYEAIRRGEIPAVRIGRRWLVPKRALERLLLGTDTDAAAA